MAYKHIKQREDVDVVRVALWYEYVRQKLSLRSPDQIEKFFQPDKFVRYENGDVSFLERWKLYQKGVHTPQPSFVQFVEAQVSGSEHILNSVLWEVIRGRKTLSWYIKNGVHQLNSEVQRVLFKSSDQLTHALSHGQLRKLERLVGLDALAAQVIFLRIADSRGDREKAFEIGRSIYKTLLILSVDLLSQSSAIALIKLLNGYVFPMAYDGCKGVYIPNDLEFLFEVSILTQLMKVNGWIVGDRKKEIRLMSDLLDGKKGFDIRFGLTAPLITTGARCEKELIKQKKKSWGLDVLRNGRVERIPPIELFDCEL